MKRTPMLAVGFFIITLIVLGLIVKTGISNKTYANDTGGGMYGSYGNHMGGIRGIGDMMRNVEKRVEMRGMMRQHHGENWQDHHNSHNNMMGG